MKRRFLGWQPNLKRQGRGPIDDRRFALYPKEIDEILFTYPKVQEAVAVGTADKANFMEEL
jgi:hypothetical protein